MTLRFQDSTRRGGPEASKIDELIKHIHGEPPSAVISRTAADDWRSAKAAEAIDKHGGPDKAALYRVEKIHIHGNDTLVLRVTPNSKLDADLQELNKRHKADWAFDSAYSTLQQNDGLNWWRISNEGVARELLTDWRKREVTLIKAES